MRIRYPNEIKKELDYLEQYLEFNGEEFVVKAEAPTEIQKRYTEVRNKMHEFEKQNFGFRE